MKPIRAFLTFAAVAALSACGFHLRGEVALPPTMQRVHLAISDPYSPLKRDLEAALARSGAKIENNAGEGIAEVTISAVSLGAVVRSVGANAYVNEFSMVYHVEIEVTDANGKTLMPKQTVEHSREFTFDQSQAIGTSAEQDEIKKEMERDMVQALLRRIEAAERKVQK
ncbi:MAG TPA: LPS assembly lipoprotein LptE [Rudaea sp.]|nr:LPS assembly lipoprotein LptE [Rudaea sp.]